MPKGRTKLQIRRPNGAAEREICRLAAHPKIRVMFSAALRRPIFPKDVYISGDKGKYIHIIVSPMKNFDKRSFRMKSAGHRGTRLIVGCPKGQWNDVTERCRVGTRLHAVLIPKDRLPKLKAKLKGKRFVSNPLLMTVMNPGYKKNPVDVEYDAKSKGYRVYRTNPQKTMYRCGECGFKTMRRRDFWKHQKKTGCAGPSVEVPLGPSRRTGRRSYRRNMTVPLWDNPEFGSLKTNPFDLAMQAMPLYNDNPDHCPGMRFCNNPGHEHNIPAADAAGFQNNIAASEAAGFQNNPGLPGYYGAVFDQNPSNPLVQEELHELDERSGQNLKKALAARDSGDYLRSAELGGRVQEDAYVAEHFAENPSLNIGDFVRNLKRVMKGMEIDLEAKQLGRIVSAGQFMGDTVYAVQFFMPDGTQKVFKFFAKELKREDNQLQFEENPLGFRDNPYRPASPRALQKYIHPKNGRRGYPKYGQLNHLSKQPASRAGVGGKGVNGTRKVKIPVAKFEAWLQRAGSPHEKRQYLKAKAAYRRFHKGADPEFITRQMVDIGTGNKQKEARSFAYSMGKSPFEPYITPKGSGKGAHKAYLHEYETMPENLTTPGGKVVIKPLEGRTKITDWIHR